MTSGVRAGQPAIQDASFSEAGRLDSWKEIASFFRREVRTVQLWERHERLPVHRHQHRKVGTVHAYQTELREWWKQRCASREAKAAQPVEPPVVETKESAAQMQITLAVLPMVFAAESAAEAPLAAGLAERIAARLDTMMPRRLRVTCSLAVAQHHAEGLRLEAKKGESGADYSLRGELRDHLRGVQIELRLMRGKDESAIWSNTFLYVQSEYRSVAHNGPGDDGIASDVAEKVSRALSNHVLMSRHVMKSKTVNPAARYAYLRGRYLWSLRSSPDAIFNAMEQFRLATEFDPQHAQAYSGLADCYAVLGWLGAIPRQTAMSEARKAAQTALELDGSLAEGHVSMGNVLFDYDWDWEGAEREMLQAIDLNQAYSQAYCWYGHVLVALGRNREAVHAAQIAQDMDPTSPMVGLFLGSALYYSGQYDDAIQQYQHVLHMQPNHSMAHCGLGMAYDQAGDLRPALSHLQFAAGMSANDVNIQSMLAYMYARMGDHGEAKTLLNRMRRSEEQQGAPALDAAAAYTAMGDYDAAMRYLDLGYEQRNARLPRLGCDPRLMPLHADPRFTVLMRRMRLD
jgi:tetratricopeptide (TPR) repeat protein/TolB-like protein